MRAWAQAALDETCGYGGCLIPASTPMLVLEGPGLRRRLRCPACAREPIGQSGWLERSIEEPAPGPRPFVPLRHITAPLPFDAKAAAAGKDP